MVEDQKSQPKQQHANNERVSFSKFPNDYFDETENYHGSNAIGGQK